MIYPGKSMGYFDLEEKFRRKNNGDGSETSGLT